MFRSAALPTAKVLLALLFVYALYRSWNISISHDESLTFFITKSTFRDITHYNGQIKSNSHLLNTVLIKWLTRGFGSSELVLRIPVLFGFLLYMFAAFKIARLFLRYFEVVAGLALLCFHPFLIDFFTCARGYGLGLGFLMLSVYYLFKYQQEHGKNMRPLIWMMTSISFTVIANLSFLHVYMAMLVSLFLFHMLDTENRRAPRWLIRTIVPSVLSAVVLLWIFYTPVQKMQKANEFYYGGTEGFWQDTVTSLIHCSLYGKTYFNFDFMLLLQLATVIVLVVAAFFLLRKYLRHRFSENEWRIFLLLSLLVFTGLSISLQFFLFNTKLVIERTAIFFIPLFLLLALLLWKSAVESALKIKSLLQYGGLLVFTLVFIHYCLSANTSSFLSWRYDADSKRMMHYLAQLPEAQSERAITFSTHPLFEPAARYYQERLNLSRMTIEKGAAYDYTDFAYTLTSDLDKFPNADVLEKFYGGEAVLLRNSKSAVIQ